MSEHEYQIKYLKMKKISLKNLVSKDVEMLSREQLKKVIGGFSGSGGSDGSDILGATCAQSCLGWDSVNLRTITGTCSKSTLPGGLEICLCSVTPIQGSGSDCYA